MLSAFACEATLILAHQEIRNAGDEVPAVQALIEELGPARRPVHRRRAALPKKLDRQSWLAELVLDRAQEGLRVAAEAAT